METPERRKELHDSKDVGKEEEGKVIEAEKTEDTDNEKILLERGDEGGGGIVERRRNGGRKKEKQMSFS